MQVLNVEIQKILSLSKYEVQELQNFNNESLDGFAFFRKNSWTREMSNLLHRSQIGKTDTFKLIFFYILK